jgi:hypothetical protein
MNEIKNGRGLFGGVFPYDVWCHHAQYSEKLLSVIKKQNALFATIVRRPAYRFVSAWYWYHAGGADLHRRTRDEAVTVTMTSSSTLAPRRTYAVTSNETLQEFIRKVAVYGEKAVSSAKFKYRSGLDATSEELVGTMSSKFEFSRKYDDLLGKIRRLEYLVLVADRFDESLVLFSYEMV